MKLKYVFFILWLIPLWGYADDDLPAVDSGITTPQQVTLNVTTTNGSVTGAVGNGTINCVNGGGQCSATVATNAYVNLTATGSSGYNFSSWSGCPSPSGSNCAFNLSQNTNVAASFTTPVQSNPSSATLIEPINGATIQSLIFNVKCIGADNDGVKHLDIVFIDKNAKRVVRETGSSLGAPTPQECLVGINPHSLGLAEGELTIQISVVDGKGNEEIPTTNNFAKINWSMPLNLNITQPQNGSIVGTIGSSNINCGNGKYDCYAPNQILTNVDFSLTPVPADGFKFDGWTGACSSMPCKLTAHDNTLSASFSAKQLPNQPPTANFTLNSTNGTAPLTVSVTQNSSTDTDGLIAKYEWKTTPDNQTSTAKTPSFTFASAGNYNITLTVTDDKGAITNSAAQKVTVSALVTEQQMLTSIRGFVWNDLNSNGLQEPGESYLPNSTVRLKRPDGSEGFAFTDVNGYYEFTGLSTGNYTVSTETRTGSLYITSEIETVKVDSINIPMSVSFGMKTVIPNTAQLQVIPADNGIIRGVIGSGILYCGYGDNVLGLDCLVNFPTNPIPFGVIQAIPKAGYSFVAWSDPSICPNTTTDLCNPILSGGKNLSLSASFKANGEPTIDPNVTIGGNVTTTPTISNVRLSSSIFEPGKQVEISWNSTGQTKYVVYLYDDSTNSLVSDAACPSNSFDPTLGSDCLLYETSSNSSVKWTVPWVLPAGHYTLKVAVGNGNNWSDAVVATTPQEALTYLEITPPDNGIISGYIGSTTIYCGHDDNNVVGDKCSAPGFSANIMRILTATPKQGFVFSQWSDASVCLFVTDTSCLPMTTGSTNAKLTANFTATESPKPMIRLVATKVPSTVKPGESFDITLRFTPDTAQLADGIEVYLEFDPTKLKINSVNNSGVLDFELSNQIGNNFVYFSAASMFNDVPTETFDLVTINVTALENTDNADNTTLHFVTDHSHVSSSGNYIPQDFEDIVINFALEPVLQCKVMLQGRPTPPAPSWKMELKLYVDGKQDTVMTDDLGQCQLPSSLLPLSAGTHSICVKNSHTLQKKLDVNIPLNDDIIDFGELIEGDTNDDNQLNLNDFRLIGMATNNAKKESCQGDAAYNSNADLNSDGCISMADAILFKSNLSNIVGGILLGDTCLTAKRGHRNTRDGDRDSLVSSAKVNLSIPTGISVGETFDVVVQVTGNVSQPIDAMSMYLNFDPASLQVNGLTPDKHLDFVLQSNFDNVLGQVNFAASRWENIPLTETTRFLTVNFTLLSKNGESSISFSADPLRQMLVLSNNFDVSSTLAKEQQSLKFVPSYTVSGTVKDKSKTALSGVTMSVATSAGEKTAVTDAAGNWEIGGLPEGEYAVKGTADNFTCLADIALGNEMYRQPVVCKQVSSLQVSAKSKPSRAIYQGENLTYLLTVTNASNKVATGVVLENYKLPEGVKVVSLTPLDGGECNLETVSCLLPDLTPGTTARAELVLSDLAAGQFHHVIHLSAEGIPTADQINTWKQVKPYLSTAVICTPNPVEMQKQLHCTATAELSSFAPELTATGVKLQLTLPKGTELKQVVAPDGECDTSQPGKLLCPLKDLSIAASDQVSKTTVDVDLQLVDSGLLVLTTEAKLTATNYAEHIASRAIRIAIPEGIEVDLVIAVDTTYSMNRIINGIIKPLEDFIQKQLADPTVIPPLTVLEEFKDDVRLVIPPTRDMKAVLDALRNLKIEGGGTCPEASVDALNLAADYLKKDGVILGATNAPARPDADVEALKKRLTEMEADGAKIFFIYQPECDVTSGIEQGDQGLGDIAVPAFPAQ